jgi:hypothetical protein
MIDHKFSLTEKIVLLKTALLDVEQIVNEAKSLQEAQDGVEAIIADELNDPTDEDANVLYRLRDKILKRHNKQD